MRNLLQCCRGAAAFATVIALVPLIGVVSIGAEAGSWYVIKQHAQNAADAAAFSGALRLACTLGAATCNDAQTVDYRAREFAAQNAFCGTATGAADGTAYPGSQCAGSLPSGVSQAVVIAIGDYSGGTFTTPPAGNGNAVRATVSQQQPAYLAAVLGLTTVTVPAQAIAQVQNPNPVCGLGLSTSLSTNSAGLTLGSNVTLGGSGCGLMSDGIIKFNSSISAGPGWDAYSVYGCTPASTCSSPGIPYNYSMQSVSNPLAVLDTASFSLAAGSTSSCGGNCTTYNPGSFNKLTVNAGDIVHFTPGVYSFSGNVNITGGTIDCPTCSCASNPAATSGTTGVNLILTGTAKLTINGGAVTLCAGTANTGTYAVLNGVLIDDQATGAVSVSGSGANPVQLAGAVYAPKTDITWGGTSLFASNTCMEVIGNTLTMSGDAYLSTNNCAPGTVPLTQVVVLVQ